MPLCISRFSITSRILLHIEDLRGDGVVAIVHLKVSRKMLVHLQPRFTAAWLQGSVVVDADSEGKEILAENEAGQHQRRERGEGWEWCTLAVDCRSKGCYGDIVGRLTNKRSRRSFLTQIVYDTRHRLYNLQWSFRFRCQKAKFKQNFPVSYSPFFTWLSRFQLTHTVTEVNLPKFGDEHPGLWISWMLTLSAVVASQRSNQLGNPRFSLQTPGPGHTKLLKI